MRVFPKDKPGKAIVWGCAFEGQDVVDFQTNTKSPLMRNSHSTSWNCDWVQEPQGFWPRLSQDKGRILMSISGFYFPNPNLWKIPERNLLCQVGHSAKRIQHAQNHCLPSHLHHELAVNICYRWNSFFCWKGFDAKSRPKIDMQSWVSSVLGPASVANKSRRLWSTPALRNQSFIKVTSKQKLCEAVGGI